jgi:hypothetical protein
LDPKITVLDVREAFNLLERLARIPESNLPAMASSFQKVAQDRDAIAAELRQFRRNFSAEFTNSRSATCVRAEKIRQDDHARLWARLWHSLTMECAPWENAVVNKSATVLVRSRKVCAGLYPVRTKRKKTIEQPAGLWSPSRKRASIGDGWRVRVISPAYERIGALSVCDGSLVFDYPDAEEVIPGKDIRIMIKRTRFHQRSALELFTWDGKAAYIEVQNVMEIMKQIAACATRLEVPPILKIQSHLIDSGKTDLWMTRRLSNFDYLLFLNVMAGRSFSDPTQYPIFPWIILNFESETLVPATFRDLRKPIADSEVGRSPVSPKALATFLARIPYDHAESGAFDSIASLCQSALNPSSGICELIPEFFYFPEFLIGQSDVKLPGWAKSPLDFVYQHRKMLESEEVSRDLRFWIDLMFGCQQEVYHPSSDLIGSSQRPSDPAETDRLWSLISENGQWPDQIFFAPHPPRSPASHSVRQWSTPLRIRIDEPNLSFGHFHCPSADQPIVVTVVGNEIRKFAIDISVNDAAASKICPTGQSVNFDAGHLPKKDVLDRLIFLKDGRTVAMIEGTSKSIQLVDLSSESISLIRSPLGNVTSIAASERHFLCTGSDMMLRLYSIDDLTRPVSSVASYRGNPVCAAISSKFGIFVSGTIDGSLIISSIHSGDVKKVVSLGNVRLAHVQISPGWGFIAVCADRRVPHGSQWELLLFSVNGLEIGKVLLDAEIAAWETIEDNAGFDFMTLALKSGNIYHFELYSLELGSALYRESGVVTVRYLAELEAVAVVTRSGSILFVPVLNPGVQ